MSRVRRLVRDSRGITLAEILVATVIISVGLVGLAIVIPISGYGVNEGNSLSTATFLAEQRLEEIRNASWTSTPSANDCLGTGSAAAPVSTANSPGCARSQPTTCVKTSDCTTYSDEDSPGVAAYPGYKRYVRITDCGSTACAGVTNAKMRLVKVTVTYIPISGVGASGTGGKSAVLEMIISKRE